MKILIVSDAWLPQRNGVVRVLMNLRDQLNLLGHQVELLTPQDHATLPCPSYPEIPLTLRPGRAMHRQVAAGRPHAIHIATEGPLGLAARRWCLRHGFPFTTAYHTKFPEYIHQRTHLPLDWLYGAIRWFHRPSSAVLAPSPSVYRELSQRGFVNVHPWAHGVDTTLFHPREQRLWDLPRPIHLFVGRLAPEKNLPAFLDLPLPGSKVVVGEGPDRETLRQRYPDVHFITARNDQELAGFFASGDVFVFPSLTDTFGLVMLEALASGVPVAAFPVTGPRDVLGLEGAGETQVGCLHPDLGEAVRRALCKSPEACRRHAAGFGWHTVAQQFLAMIRPVGLATP
ncbi:MAG: glycosyltransferase family 1 protein [Magnetococcus sp. WYHC-3]